MPHGIQTYKLNKEDEKYMFLWSFYLEKAYEGISINRLVLRHPTQYTMSDTCTYGLGGFTSFGMGWRLKIDNRSLVYGNDTTNNALEFLGLVMTLWLLLLDCKERGLTEELIISLA